MEWKVRVRGRVKSPIPRTTVTGSLQDERFDPPKGMVFFDGVVANRVDFSKRRFFYFAASGSEFVDCDFTGTRFGQAIMSHSPQTVYRRCVFDRTHFPNTMPGQARFERCRFRDAKLDHWFCFQAEFVECQFAGRIVECKFTGRPTGPGADDLRPKRSINEFRGNDFREATLIDTEFIYGVDIGAQLWPDDPAYIRLDRLPERIEAARREIVTWEDLKARKQALILLDVYSQAGHEEQQELFTRRADLAAVVSASVLERVWLLLSGALPT